MDPADLWSLAQKIDSFVNFDIYTDGSYNNSPSTNEFHMGYGWHISNIMDFDLFYHGAIEHFPSSTKAEIMAILTALIILPPHSSVNIFTDFQAAIEGYKKSSQLHFISPRRYKQNQLYFFMLLIPNASSTQSVSLVWNDEVVLDKDIRKNMARLLTIDG
ncbi:unnamed protein product [Rhizophagus irregularis]|nr:unnamed protein product [Rhizophagus irregularis]